MFPFFPGHVYVLLYMYHVLFACMYLSSARKLVMYVCIRMDDISFSCCYADVAVLGLSLRYRHRYGRKRPWWQQW